MFSILETAINFREFQLNPMKLKDHNEGFRKLNTVSFLTIILQYDLLKFNFALRANVNKTDFPMIVYLQSSKKLSQDLYLFKNLKFFKEI